MPKPSVPQNLPNVQRILAVASGKGGVGKSTVAFHLARAFAQTGLRVGLLDADLHGPSLPFFMRRESASLKPPESPDGRTLLPLESHGLFTMSMGFLVPEGKAAIWRGPMMHHALDQLIFKVNWGELDLLMIDLPPGTGDIPLSLAQKLLMSALVVSTSQDLALQDVRRGIEMFQKVGVPLVGIVENMATLQCSHCGEKTLTWGSSRVEAEAARQGVPFWGSIPLNPLYQKICPEEAEASEDFQTLACRLLKASPFFRQK